MFTSEPRDDGFMALHENGRAVAHVETHALTETNDPNLRVQKRIATPLEPDKVRIHFTGYRFTFAELEAFLAELEGLAQKK